jgi:hypothetical protein
MKYKILSTTTAGDTIITEIEYEFNDNLVRVSVPHFQPKNKKDIERGIANRAISEKRKLEASIICNDIILELELNKKIDISDGE